MHYLPVVCLAFVHGLSLLMPLGENLHAGVVPRLFGWPGASPVEHIASHLGTVLALLIVLRREVGESLLGVWQLVRGQWRPEARLTVNLVIALLPIGVLRLLGFADYVSRFGFGRLDYLALTGMATAVVMLLADRYSLAIRRVEHMSAIDALVLGLAQIIAFMPGIGLIPLAMTVARVLGFERPDAVRISYLMALFAFGGEVLLSGSRFYVSGALAAVPEASLALTVLVSALGGLFAAAIFLGWLERHSMTPFLVYRLLASAAALALFPFFLRHLLFLLRH